MAHSLLRRFSRGILGLLLAAAPLTGGLVSSPTTASALRPAAIDAQFLGAGPAPPTQAACGAVGRRCFNPISIQNSYNLTPLYNLAAPEDGRGQTIAIIDSFGSVNIAHDLHVFDSWFGVQAMCGEEAVACTGGMPTFNILHVQGSPAPVPSGQGKNGTGTQNRGAWALEVSLDVEWAHSVAPMANILLVTTPVAETQGVQGIAQMMNAEQFVIDNHLATVISQSFGTTEENLNGNVEPQRHAFESAPAAGVTVLASSGDGGITNASKTPTKNTTTYPFPTVIWPASDPLVTAVGGTYLCTNPVTGGMTADHNFPPSTCSGSAPREIGWVDSGGGFSHLFSRPSYQDTLPTGSTAIPVGQRGVPDVGLQASSKTGVLIYSSEPGIGSSGTCPAGSSCDGWFVIGGTSASAPQWAGIVAIADQVNGGGLGLINPALYAIGANASRYANDFFDVTVGNNPGPAGGPGGFNSHIGWDPVTGLGTPNAFNLVPDLVAAAHGH